MIGTRVRGQVFGDYPSLSNLDGDGNFKPNVDFRGVYSALLEQWLDTDADGIVPNAKKFARPKLIK